LGKKRKLFPFLVAPSLFSSFVSFLLLLPPHAHASRHEEQGCGSHKKEKKMYTAQDNE